VVLILNDFPDGPVRRQKAGDAFNEVSSLGPAPSRGVDARSLAAKVPSTGGFTIRRVDMGSSDGGGGHNFRSPNYRGGGPGGFRGGARGGVRGRGGARGRGRGALRAKGKAGPKDRKKLSIESDYVEQPYTEEELAYVHESESGFNKPYEPTTSLADLAGYGAPTISSPRGIQENLVNHFASAVGADFRASGYKLGRDHLYNIARNGFTQFENTEQRQITEEWMRKEGQEAHDHLERMSVVSTGVRGLATLSDKQKTEILGGWVAGQYVPPKAEQKDNVLSTVGMLTTRNETYLPADAKRLEDKLRTLLPKQAAARPVGKPRAAI
jgi:hypothetical protein